MAAYGKCKGGLWSGKTGVTNEPNFVDRRSHMTFLGS